MKPWKHLEAPEVTKVGWRYITRKLFERPDGVLAEYVVYGRAGDRAAAVLAVTEDGNIVVAEQFRPAAEMIMQELPGGGVAKGEDTQAAALRELLEETGYASDDVVYLGECRKDAYIQCVNYFYLARNCRRIAEPTPDDGEFIDVKLITIDELIANAKEGRMTDSAAVLMAYEQLMQIQKGE